MVFQSDYEFADLEQADVKQIDELERRLSERAGEKVTLIAYSHSEKVPDSSCRSDLND